MEMDILDKFTFMCCLHRWSHLVTSPSQHSILSPVQAWSNRLSRHRYFLSSYHIVSLWSHNRWNGESMGIRGCACTSNHWNLPVPDIRLHREEHRQVPNDTSPHIPRPNREHRLLWEFLPWSNSLDLSVLHDYLCRLTVVFLEARRLMGYILVSW